MTEVQIDHSTCQVEKRSHCDVQRTECFALGEKLVRRRLFSRILDSLELSMKEFIVILVLLILFNFAGYLGHVNVESEIPVEAGSKTIRYYGVPLEWLQLISVWVRIPSPQPGITRLNLRFMAVNINWATLVLDLTLYFLLAFAIVYGIGRLRSRKRK